eukprot:495853-Rhodomonas_salina.1
MRESVFPVRSVPRPRVFAFDFARLLARDSDIRGRGLRSSARRDKTLTTTISVLSVPGVWFILIDFAACGLCGCEGPRHGAEIDTL